MARKRMIDPNIWQSESFSKLSPFSRLVFIGLFSMADDSGRGRAKPHYIKSILFPYDDVRVADVDKALSEIGLNMSVTFYRTHDGSEYYSLDNWRKWQRVDKPSDSMLPVCDGCEKIRGTEKKDTYIKTHDTQQFGEHSGSVPGTVPPKRKEEKRKENIYSDITNFLNQKAGTCYRASSSETKKLIDARLNEGFTLENFKQVIEVKCSEWNHEPREGGADMRKYLRPETLFSSKFEGYLNQSPPTKPREPLPPPAWVNKDNPTVEEILGVDFGDG